MSVVKGKRKPSQFEVFHHLNKMRREVTDLLLRDFGYNHKKAVQSYERLFNGRPYESLDENERTIYDRRKARDEAFTEWFILDERNVIVNCLRQITACVYVANSIYPKYPYELAERRLQQDKAIGYCYDLVQELQYVIETLPVDMNKYTRFSEMIGIEIKLIKGWRKSDNRFLKGIKWNDCESCHLKGSF